MKLVIILACLAITTMAAPADDDVKLVSFSHNQNSKGHYNYNYELSDGTKRNEKRGPKNPDQDDSPHAVHGTYSWIDPDGTPWVVKYMADENGYHAETLKDLSSQVIESLVGR